MGSVLGAGFIANRGSALTCAHVVEKLSQCWIDLPETGQTFRCDVRYADPDWTPEAPDWRDVAVITVPDYLPTAPVGPLQRPGGDSVLDVLGFPARYAEGDNRGQRTRVHVVGPDERNRLLQVDGLQGFDGTVQQGYSGGPAVDVQSGRVVGMVVASDRLRAAVPGQYAVKIAWIIPIDTLVGVWPPLQLVLPHALSVDPEYVAAISTLRHGGYGQALTQLNQLSTTYPHEPDMYFYRALAGLAGVRPGAYARPMVEAVEALLRYARNLRPVASVAHVSLLWALVKEDYYLKRGIPEPEGDPEIGELMASLTWIERNYAVEIVRHVPARECTAWKKLDVRSAQP
jgi:hypothetical protein